MGRSLVTALVTSVAAAKCPVEARAGRRRMGILVGDAGDTARSYLYLLGDEATPWLTVGDIVRVTPIRVVRQAELPGVARPVRGALWFVDYRRGKPLYALAAAIAAVLAAAFLAASAVLAAALAVAGLGDKLARALNLHFGNPPRGADVALLIGQRNLALAAVPLVAAYVVPHARSWTAAVDLFLIVVICAQVALVGATFAAYGERQLRSAAPYAPLELLSFCLAPRLPRDAARQPATSAPRVRQRPRQRRARRRRDLRGEGVSD